MKLQVGERYRMRNGEIVGPLSHWGKDPEYRFTEDGGKGKLWNESGKRYMKTNEDPTDIIEHIPNKDTMSEKTIKINRSAFCTHISDETYYSVTLAEAERLGAEAQRIKAENEIKARDFVIFFDSIRCVKAVVSERLYFEKHSSYADVSV